MGLGSPKLWAEIHVVIMIGNIFCSFLIFSVLLKYLENLYALNIDEEYERLKGLGVEFFLAPTEVDYVKVAILDDTCGNYIQLMQFLVPN